MTNPRLVRIVPDGEHLAYSAAAYLVEMVEKSDAVVSVVLSGGSTPKRLYQLLATDTFARRIDWQRLHVFWGDERCVPPDHADSNYRMARESLLDHVPIPDENVHRIAGELDPTQAAALYEQHLRAFFSGQPRFDLILLGLGNDGHTASLFPHTPALDERERWVVADYYAPVQPPWRVTLTPPAINAAARVVFLVSGEEKADMLRRVLEGEFKPHELPAQLIQPISGELTWLVDETAASRIKA